MAIVEDEALNESEEDNEIVDVVEEDDGEGQDDSGDESDDDGSDDEEAIEGKVQELEKQLEEDVYNYDKHMDLIQALWGLSELKRWRAAFERLRSLLVVNEEDWTHFLSTEATLAHTEEDRLRILQLFQQATLDCYSVPLLTEWCGFAAGTATPEETAGPSNVVDEEEPGVTARAHVDDVVRRVGADPAMGHAFWDVRLAFERDLMDALTETDAKYKEQLKNVVYCLEEIVSRPLLKNEEKWKEFEELATKLEGPEYVEKVKKQHEIAKEFLDQITTFIDRIRNEKNANKKCKIYEEYADKLLQLEKNPRYGNCDVNNIIKCVYSRAVTECATSRSSFDLCVAQAKHARQHSSTQTYSQLVCVGIRRHPRRAHFYTLRMRDLEQEGESFEKIKSVLESALTRGLESYNETEAVWLGYLEYLIRKTDVLDTNMLDRLRKTFRLAWDSLAEMWGQEANDCALPLLWADIEYLKVKDYAQGKELFEEMFRYGTNKKSSRYWEAAISLESAHLGKTKMRDLYRRAVKFVDDYPPTICEKFTNWERLNGDMESLEACIELCQDKKKKWRDAYEAERENRLRQKKGKQNQGKTKKGKKDDNDCSEDENVKERRKNENAGKRKFEKPEPAVSSKKMKNSPTKMEVQPSQPSEPSRDLKRPHDEDHSEASSSKRSRNEAPLPNPDLEACTLFVSNLEFNVDEGALKAKLSDFGDVVTLRVKAGVKAFGGSICYCQYTTTEAVDVAVKNDRCTLGGRPMFLSRYKSGKAKAAFKYSTGVEKNKLFVKNLPFGICTKSALTDLFGEYGALKDVRVVTYKDGRPKGLAYIEYEDEKSAAAALKANGKLIEGRNIDVALSAPPSRAEAPASASASLGQPKRTTGGMRRTQLTSFIPSVLQRGPNQSGIVSSTNSQLNGNTEKKSLNNNDFRNAFSK